MIGVLKHQSGKRHQSLVADFLVADVKVPLSLIESRENAGQCRLTRAVVTHKCRNALPDGKTRTIKNDVFVAVSKTYAAR